MVAVTEKNRAHTFKSLEQFLRNLQRVQVYALIGKSGTGKSFRSYLLLEKFNIDLLIDDGLLIRNQHILSGISAKNEQNYLSAVKRALFQDEGHCKAALQVLGSTRPRRILILGTSKRMIDIICKQLNLPAPKKEILIENIASRHEIAQAQSGRKTGKHTIPVPIVEVQKDHPKLGAKSLRVTFKNKKSFLRQGKQYEKSIVHPTYGHKGVVSISETAISQMLMHCIEEFDRSIEIIHIVIKPTGNEYSIDIHISLPYKYDISQKIRTLQEYTTKHIETYANITLYNINVIVSNIRK